MITASGIGSGLDIEGLVSQLVAAERAPTENRLNRQDARVEAQLSAFGTFKSALASLQDSLAALNDLNSFGVRASESSDTDVVEASADGEAVNGNYDISVEQLAKSHSLASGSYASVQDTVGTGTLTIRFGSTDYVPPDPGPESYNGFTVNPERAGASIVIDSSNNSLEGVRDAINDADAGVNATIVNDGSGFRLLLSSDFSGERNSLQVSVADTGDGNDADAAGLSALAFNGAATNLQQTVAAQDANFTVNGLAISSAGNVVDNVIDGVDLTLKSTGAATPVTLTVSEDREAVKETIGTFIDGFNEYVQSTRDLTAFDPVSGTAGALQGDSSIRGIAAQLRQVIGGVVEGAEGAVNSLGQLGITTSADGTLALNEQTLDSALQQNFDDIVSLFAAIGVPSDTGIEFAGSANDTVAGSYAVEITQVATRGQYAGGPVAFQNGTVAIDGDNDGLSVNVDGVASGTIALAQGSYASGEALAAEIQSKINDDPALQAAGVSVAVAFTGGSLVLSSNRYGSSSGVEILGADTASAATLGISPGAGVQGVDVAGSIGGVAGLGSGRILTGAAGSDSAGLRLSVEGGTTGPRGVVTFSRGVTDQLNTLISGFLDSEGILDIRTAGLQDRADRLDDQRERLDRRMEALEISSRNRFNALDSLLAQLQSTSNFLTQQLGSLPQAGSARDN